MPVMHYVYLIVVLASLAVTQAAPTGAITAADLLDRYAETQDQLRSCRMVVESQREGFSSGLMAGKPWELKTLTREDVAIDGVRARVRSWTSGRINPTSFYEKDDPYYVSELWDGTTHFRYVCGQVSGHEDRNAYISRNFDEQERQKMGEQVLMNNSTVKILMGYFYGQPERIDRVLRRAESLTVRAKMEKVGDADCYVVDAAAGATRYTLWLDPTHGYHIARFRMVTDDRSKEGLQQVRIELRDTKFEQTDGVWACAGGRLRDRFVYSGGHYCHDTYDIEVKELTFDLNHDQPRYFIPDDIPDGTYVKILDGELIKGRGHIWTKGIVRDEAGKVVAVFPPTEE